MKDCKHLFWKETFSTSDKMGCVLCNLRKKLVCSVSSLGKKNNNRCNYTQGFLKGGGQSYLCASEKRGR